MSTPTKYFVWKRNDGHIGVALGSMPTGWTTGGAYRTFEGAGQPVTFEKLAEFPSWEGVSDFVEAQRSKQ